jgi:nitrous oxide reductase accessory protein NosL
MPLRRRLRALFLIGISVIGASSANALPLTPFRHEAQAQRHCPGDTVVWLDFRKEVYYVKRQKRYGQGSTGSFVCQKEARASGFRRSLLGIR